MRESLESTNSPLGVILVAKNDAAERILFIYPFDNIMSNDRVEVTPEEIVSGELSDKTKTSDDWSCAGENSKNRFGIPLKMLASLLCTKGVESDSGGPFEIKIGSYRFAGHPWRINGCVHTLVVVFVLFSCAEAWIIEAFQKLSKKIAIAIDNEQQRCNYFEEQICLMQPAHDEFDSSEEQKKEKNCLYTEVLERSGLARHIKDIYDDIIEYGIVEVFLDDCIEVGFCIEPKATMDQDGISITSSSIKDVERTMQGLCPYHSLLFLHNTTPSPDSNPIILRFFEVYRPTRRNLTRVLEIVRHYLLWGRAIAIYPICSTNIYVNSINEAKMPFSRAEIAFRRKFPNCKLDEILEHFSLPSSIGGFLADSSIYSPTSMRSNILTFLLRHQLLTQLHTYIYLIEPNNCIKSVKTENDSNYKHFQTEINSSNSLSPELKITVYNICVRAINTKSQEQEIKKLVTNFISLLPFTSGKNHLEDIMCRIGISRTQLMRVIDMFSDVLCLFYCQDIILDKDV